MASRSRKRKIEEAEEVKEEAAKEAKVDEKEGVAGLEIVQQQQEGLVAAVEEDAGPMMLTRLEASVLCPRHDIVCFAVERS